MRKDGENGDKNCISIEINYGKNSIYEFSRISCSQKTIKKPFICKMNQSKVLLKSIKCCLNKLIILAGLTRLFNLPTQPEIKDGNL